MTLIKKKTEKVKYYSDLTKGEMVNHSGGVVNESTFCIDNTYNSASICWSHYLAPL